MSFDGRKDLPESIVVNTSMFEFMNQNLHRDGHEH